MVAEEDVEKATVEYTDLQITEKSYDPETETLTLDVDCVKKTESEYVELNFNLSSSSDTQK